MILTCPNCATRFVLPAQSLGPEGRRVKCSSCQEIWFQLPDPEEIEEQSEDGQGIQPLQDIPEAVKPIPEGSNVPALKGEDQPKGSGMVGASVLASVIFVLLFAVLMFGRTTFATAWPASNYMYGMLGYDLVVPGQGLVFDSVKAEANAQGIKIAGHIINLTSRSEFVPMIRASFKDAEGREIDSIFIEPPARHLEAEQIMEFSSVADLHEAHADNIHLSFSISTQTETETQKPDAETDIKLHTNASQNENDNVGHDKGHDTHKTHAGDPPADMDHDTHDSHH